jgi:hypothetical protein
MSPAPVITYALYDRVRNQNGADLVTTVQQQDERIALLETQNAQLLKRIEELEKWVNMPKPEVLKGDWHLNE